MCKNVDSPCPGCKKHKRTDPLTVFFTDEERQESEFLSKPKTPLDTAEHP
jgi:hypothetical protein